MNPDTPLPPPYMPQPPQARIEPPLPDKLDVRALFDTFARAGLAPFDHQQPGGTIDGPVSREWGDLTFDAHDPDGHEWSFVQR